MPQDVEWHTATSQRRPIAMVASVCALPPIDALCNKNKVLFVHLVSVTGYKFFPATLVSRHSPKA
jgi:hypothetical protein